MVLVLSRWLMNGALSSLLGSLLGYAFVVQFSIFSMVGTPLAFVAWLIFWIVWIFVGLSWLWLWRVTWLCLAWGAVAVGYWLV